MRNSRNATTALVTLLAMGMGVHVRASDEPITAADQQEPTIELHIANYRALPQLILDGARARVEQVYQAIGVRTVWIDSEETIKPPRDGRLHLTVMLLPRDMEKKISAGRHPDHMLGLAHLPSRRAYIFCDRIAALSGVRLMLPISLGNVIAHEIGHFVLRAKRHSLNGIMRAHVNLHASQSLGFDNAQAHTIRNRLLELRAGVP
jgi:hypothetical protein